MNSIVQLLAGGFLVSLVLGGAAQASQFCPQGGLREAVLEGRPQRLAAYFAATGFALLAVAGLQWLLHQGLQPSHPPYLSPQFPWGRYVLGGLLFGSGMVLARGCPLRTLVLSAQGSVPALLSLGAMSVAAFAMTSGFVFNDWIAPWILRLNLDLGRWGWQSQGLDALLGLHGWQARALLGLALGALVLVLAARASAGETRRMRWAGSALIGLMVADGYWLTAGPLGTRAANDAAFMSQPPDGMGVQSFSFAGPLSDLAHFAMHAHAQTFTFGVVLVLGTFLGAAISALVRREFRVQLPRGPRDLARRLLGALMTGAGAVLGLGCTVGHGLSGLSVLSLGSALGLACIFAGALGTIWIESRCGAKASVGLRAQWES
ncbi:YeeE/YedE family protein [Thiomonas sp. FB-Cd]|uniref:YeeE/YedE family protein n=1 Tax=Thiomonas sp. FB-Cd TaxID=1158292 RepID=UPI0004DEE84A|nr:YeeE/YedE family protein [Thiomonas sp. FB-Cd]